MKDQITKILYENSTDDSGCLRVKFENIPSIIEKIENAVAIELKIELKNYLLIRKERLEKTIQDNLGHRSTIQTKTRLKEIERLINNIIVE